MAMESLFLISFGTTILPSSSILRITPVDFKYKHLAFLVNFVKEILPYSDKKVNSLTKNTVVKRNFEK